MHKNIWDFWAGRYEKLWVQKYSLKPTRDLVITELKKYMNYCQEEASLLDVGCGTGQLLEDIRQREPAFSNLTLTGIDKSEKMIVSAVKKLRGVDLLVGDALALPFRDNQFTFLTCCHSLPYYSDILKALKEFKRVIKPKGIIFLIQASENTVYDRIVMKLVKFTTGKAVYPSKVQIKEFAQKAGLIVVEQKALESRFFMPSIILSILKNGEQT